MRRKCRLTDTWLTQRVLLDSRNVTLAQGAERCTLNLSTSNNRSPSICLLKLNVEMTDLLWKENILDTFSARPSVKRLSELLVLITKYKCLFFSSSVLFSYANTNTQLFRICISSNILLDEYTVVEWWLCLHQQQRHLQTQRRTEKNGVYYKSDSTEGYSSSMVC